MKRVLITGSTGQIGQRISSELTKRGFDVVGISSRQLPVKAKVIKSHIPFDILSGNLEELMKNLRPELLIHLAWDTRPNIFWSSSSNRLWTQKSMDLIKFFWKWGGEKVVVAGSCAEYDWRLKIPLSESSPEFPGTVYGQAKLDLLNFLRAQNMPYLWTRTFFQFGSQELHGRFIPSLIDSLWKREEFLINRPEDIRDFIFVDDVVQIMTLLIISGKSGIFNVGSGQGVKVGDLAWLIASMMDQRELLVYQHQIEEISVVWANISKIADILDSFTITSLDEALNITIEERCLS